MRTKATAKYVRLSSRKAGLVLELIRGKPVGEALAILEYTPRAAARLIAKVLRSAVANAEHNHQVRNLDSLRVVEAIAEGGPSLKRVQPRAMGRAFFIRHRTSHLTVAVSDEVNGARRAPAPAAPAAPAEPSARTRRAQGGATSAEKDRHGARGGAKASGKGRAKAGGKGKEKT